MSSTRTIEAIRKKATTAEASSGKGRKVQSASRGVKDPAFKPSHSAAKIACSYKLRKKKKELNPTATPFTPERTVATEVEEEVNWEAEAYNAVEESFKVVQTRMAEPTVVQLMQMMMEQRKRMDERRLELEEKQTRLEESRMEMDAQKQEEVDKRREREKHKEEQKNLRDLQH